jgi:hypothetical protein
MCLPKYHDQGQEYAWAHLLQKNVRQGLEDGVADKEDCKTSIVLSICHFEIFLQAVDFCVTNVGSVEEGD